MKKWAGPVAAVAFVAFMLVLPALAQGLGIGRFRQLFVEPQYPADSALTPSADADDFRVDCSTGNCGMSILTPAGSTGLIGFNNDFTLGRTGANDMKLTKTGTVSGMNFFINGGTAASADSTATMRLGDLTNDRAWLFEHRTATGGGDGHLWIESRDVSTFRAPVKIELAAPSNLLYLSDDGSGRVGIRTTTPSSTLHVLDTNNSQLTLAHDGTYKTTIGVNSTGTTTFYNSSSVIRYERALSDGAISLALRGATPGTSDVASLHLEDVTNNREWRFKNRNADGGNLHLQSRNVSSFLEPFKVALAAPTNLMFLAGTGNGRVGIRTATPNNTLEVVDTTSPQVRVAYDGTDYVTHGVASGGNYTVTAPTATSVSVVRGAGSALTADMLADDLHLSLPDSGGMTVSTPTTATSPCYYIQNSATSKAKICIEATTNDMRFTSPPSEPIVFYTGSRGATKIMTLDASAVFHETATFNKNFNAITGGVYAGSVEVASGTDWFYTNTAQARGQVSATNECWKITNSPAKMSFADCASTTYDTIMERGAAARFDYTATLAPKTTATYDLGTSSLEWNNLLMAGTITFDGDTTLTRSAANTLSLGTGDSLSTSSTGQLIGGTRWSLSAAKTPVNGDSYLEIGSVPMTTAHGFPMARSGSIIGVSCQVVCGFHVTDGKVNCEVHKGGTDVFSVETGTIGAGTGSIVAYSTQAPGTDTFAAGDVLSLFADWDGTYDCSSTIVIVVELQQDS